MVSGLRKSVAAPTRPKRSRRHEDARLAGRRAPARVGDHVARDRHAHGLARVRELPSHVLAHEDLEHVARERRAAVAAGHADPAAAVGPARQAVPLADRHQLVEQALARPRAELVEDARQDIAVVRRVAAAVADAKARRRSPSRRRAPRGPRPAGAARAPPTRRRRSVGA
jgi:hypothetical protein